MFFEMEYSPKKGVFSPCVSMDSASMIKCLQVLRNAYPVIKFNSISADEKLKGFKILFSEPDDSVVLERNQLVLEGQPMWIYPLTAYIIILDVDQRKTSLFERDLRDAISRRFGRVLGIVKTGSTSTSHSKDWRLEIDVPEFKGLEVFQRDSFSEMKIYLQDRDEKLKVKLWCRQCKMCGHFQHECLDRDNNDSDGEPKKNVNGKTDVKFESDSKNRDNRPKSPVGDDKAGPSEGRANFSLEPTESYAEKIGREEIIRAGILTNENQKNKAIGAARNADPSTSASVLLTDTKIKKEIEDRQMDCDFKETKSPDKSVSSGSKKPLNFKNLKEDLLKMSTESEAVSNGDDEISIIGESSIKPKSPSGDSNSFGNVEAGNFEDASRSPPGDKSALSFSSTPGPSYEIPSAKTLRGAEVTTALSERLQECINHTCDTCRILDRKKLDAFLIHVKKKSNPIRVALNYTANAKGLKEQLQQILHMYYNTPQTGTKEDIQFIKWLNGLVERFDGSIPRKRKRGGQSNDESPRKK